MFTAVLSKLKSLDFDRSGVSLEARNEEARKHREQLEDGIFGVLYTLSKERGNRSTWVFVLKSFVSFLQLLAFIISPTYNWRIDFQQRFFRLLSGTHMQSPISSQGMSRGD